MHASPLTSAALSLAGAAAWGAGDYNGGIATKNTNAFGCVAMAHATGLLCMLAMALITREAVPSATAWMWGAAAGVGGGLGLAALYRALAIGKMGINAPVAAVLTAALPVLVSFRTEGMPTSLQIAGFSVALVAIWMIAMPSGGVARPEGLGLALLAGVGFSIFLVFSKQAATESVFWPLVAARAASAITMIAVIGAGRVDWKPPHSALRYIVYAGVLDSVGNAFFVAATRAGRLDVAAVLTSLYPASTVLLARFLLKERFSGLQAAGMAAALVAIPMIAAH